VGIPAIVTAGDTRAAKAVYGESKIFLEVAGRPMVAHVVAALQRVPEVSEVWVVGNRERLRPVLDAPELQAELTKPLFLVEQLRNLMENSWETFRRFLARDTEAGCDPVGDQLDQAVLYLSGDLPFATPQEISAFIAQSSAAGCNYALGLVPDDSLEDFEPTASGEPGIEVAYFNLREGRLRQSNLHWARPARIGNRYRIEDMYEHRHQREFWNMAILAGKLFWSRAGGPMIVFFYTVMHLAGVFDRWRLRWLSDWLRQCVTLPLSERVVGRVLDTNFRFIITEAGGCAIDVDTEEEYDVVRERFESWKKAQQARAEAIYGPIPLPATASGAGAGPGRAE
jgi:GTP:adenosylcobinamide-phosphate guanylyltransferase